MGPDWGRKFLLRLGMTPRAKTTSRIVSNEQVQNVAVDFFQELSHLQEQYNIVQVCKFLR